MKEEVGGSGGQSCREGELGVVRVEEREGVKRREWVNVV